MSEKNLLQLAQDLEWLGCELEYYGHKHAMEGFPGAGPTWDIFLGKQRGVLRTAEKIEHELKTTVRYNPADLFGVDYPIEAALDSIGLLLNAVQEIKQTAVASVQEVPGKVRSFNRLVHDAFGQRPDMFK